MPYRIYLYILTQIISTGRAEAFFAGINVEFTLDEKSGKWIISSPVGSKKEQKNRAIKEFFPRQCKARFTSKESYLFCGNGENVYLRQEISQGNRYTIFREMFVSYLKEAEDWRIVFSS
jgi:hypothetical protein